MTLSTKITLNLCGAGFQALGIIGAAASGQVLACLLLAASAALMFSDGRRQLRDLEALRGGR